MSDETTTVEIPVEMIEAGKREIKAFKMFCEMCLTLPDDFLPMTQEKADALMEPKCQELFKRFTEDGTLCQKDVEWSLNLMYFIGQSTTGRAKTFFGNLVKEMNHILTGYYEPEKDMPVNELVGKVKELQTK